MAPGAPTAGAAYEPSGPCRSRTADDFDGDGVRDIAIGAPYATAGRHRRAGAVAVRYDGRTTWLTARPAALDAGFVAALATWDFNGDHCADLAVAAPDEGMAQPGADGTGRVYVLLGSPAGLHRHVTLSVRDLGRRPGEDRFGSALAAADLGGDGAADLAAGAPGTGFVWILTGHRGLSGGDGLASPAGRTAQFGWTLTARGRDLYAGAPGAGGFGGLVQRVRDGRRATVQTGTAGELLGYAAG